MPSHEERQYWGVFEIVSPHGMVREQAAYDDDGRPVEMACDEVLSEDGLRVLWSRPAEAGWQVTGEVRRRAEDALSEAKARTTALRSATHGSIIEGELFGAPVPGAWPGGRGLSESDGLPCDRRPPSRGSRWFRFLPEGWRKARPERDS